MSAEIQTCVEEISKYKVHIQGSYWLCPATKTDYQSSIPRTHIGREEAVSCSPHTPKSTNKYTDFWFY